ncbi:Alpha-amylase [Dyadobacter sp. CECT 9275]|uniref:Alpha-amylase n=1 Tax=Dyadobacter helix TaxID=2822344 RepID=A0A916N503_9BACT|nr:alpha-amylase family glycosyl hydrolase [Dyadobacter sp. CECT 9275]CAG4994438.1 Alpha-amylase [Dyadobacter sp. CECT 9275]
MQLTDFHGPVPIPKVCYEIFVRSFCDSNGDGIGDIRGIISKLSYLKELGIEALWLTPVHPSPSYHKYDVRDYYDIEPEYGTLSDFRELMHEAHQLGIAVYLDLIINHTSTLHPWFVEARKNKDSRYRNFYWWKNDAEINMLGIARRETSNDSQEVYPWHDNGEDSEKYYGLFYKGMPDLNYESAELRQEVARIINFWLTDVGVDGFRLDAARHIYPIWAKADNCEFWKFFSETIHNARPGAFTVGEVWAEKEEVAPYFQHINAAFNFDLSFAIQRILVREKDEDLVAKLIASYTLFKVSNPQFVDAIMLTNHDQDRIGSVVNNDERKKKLAASILLTLPGQPYIYYGEEIGMLGMKPDPHIREPFLWTVQEDDPEKPSWIEAVFSTLETVKPLSVQQRDQNSLFYHYKNLIALKKSRTALGKVIEPNLLPYALADEQMLAYIRYDEEESFLIVHNLTSEIKEIDLSQTAFKNILFTSNQADCHENDIYRLGSYASCIFNTSPQPAR